MFVKSLVQLLAGITAVIGGPRLLYAEGEEALEAKLAVWSLSKLLPQVKSLKLRML